MNNRILVLSILVLCQWFAAVHSGFAQGNNFTYQGVLNQGGAPVNGSNDLTFTLYNALSGGSSIGTSNVVDDLLISTGVFTVTLDFGPGAFEGSGRWLEIAVRPGASTGAFASLTPRQAVTPSPYAIYAGGVNASGVVGSLPSANLAGTYSSAMTLNNAGNAFSGAFSGNGGGLTNLNASNLASGTVPNARLAGTYTSPVTISNILNNFAGNGSGLTGLNASQLTFGTVPLGALNNAWKIFGNTGTSPSFGHFVGTTDFSPLEVKVNSSRALRIEPNATSPNLVGGHPDNSSGGSFGVAIGGGGNFTDANLAMGNYSVIGGGLGNLAAELATVSGGASNQAMGVVSVVSGGMSNLATGDFSVVSGGMLNSATTNFATVSGGTNNLAEGFASSVSGGSFNSATTNYATVSGGQSNLASGFASVVGGGESNRAIQHFSTASGGRGNKSDWFYTTVGGGQNNTAIHNHATVGGGVANQAIGQISTIGGGQNNRAYSTGTTVGGGRNNVASNLVATVGGGELNRSLRMDTTIGGGFQNLASADRATVGGGTGNVASGTNSTVGGGRNNLAEGFSATVGGGLENSATNEFSTVSGGLAGTAGGTNSTVGGGMTNLALGNYSTIPGGQQARADHHGQLAHASGAFEKSGDAQHSVFVLRGITDSTLTLGATSTNLALDGITNHISVPNQGAMTFHILIVAKADPMTSTTKSAGWEVSGVVKTDGIIASFVGVPIVNTLGDDFPLVTPTLQIGPGPFDLSIAVDSAAFPNGAVRWVARVDTVEIRW